MSRMLYSKDMLLLYTGTSCPFCRQTEAFLESRGIDYEPRNVHERDEYVEELLQMGGKRQIPFLVDTEQGVSMYESADIIKYIEDTYGANPSVD